MNEPKEVTGRKFRPERKAKPKANDTRVYNARLEGKMLYLARVRKGEWYPDEPLIYERID